MNQMELKALICTQLPNDATVEELCGDPFLRFDDVVTKFATRFKVVNCQMVSGPAETTERLHIVGCQWGAKRCNSSLLMWMDSIRYSEISNLGEDGKRSRCISSGSNHSNSTKWGTVRASVIQRGFGPLVVEEKFRELQESLKALQMSKDESLPGFVGLFFLLEGRNLIRRDISIDESGVHFKDQVVVKHIVARDPMVRP